MTCKILIPLLILISTIPLTAKEGDNVSIQLKWHHQFQFAGVYMAKEKGFFSDQAIDVEILEGGTGIDVEQRVLSGEADFGILGSELLIAQSEKKPFLIISPIMQHSIRMIIARRDKGINSLHDLVGKKMMLNENELPEFQAMVFSEGIDWARLNIIPKSSDANALFLDGEICAINGSIGNQPFIFEKNKVGITKIRPISYGIDFYGDTLFSTRELGEKNPLLVENFKNALLKGWEYAMENPEETISIIQTHYNREKSKEQLQYEYEQLEKIIRPPFCEIGHNNKDRWQRIAHIYRELGLVDKDFNLDNSFFDLQKIKLKKTRMALIILTVIILIICFIMLFISLLNRRLRQTNTLKSAEIESLIDSMPSILVCTTERGVITLWNSLAEKVTNIKKKKALGTNLFEKLPILSSYKEIIMSHIQSGNILDKLRIKEPGIKETIHRELTIYPIISKSIRGAVLRIDDISESIRINERLAQNEKMISLGGLAAGMAHEINNPLAGMIQLNYVISRRLIENPLSPQNYEAAEKSGINFEALKTFLQEREVPSMLESINGAGKRISQIVKNLISFSQNKIRENSMIQMTFLLDKTLEMIRSQQDLKQIISEMEISIETNYEETSLYPCEYDKIQQVLYNIISNGIESMEDKNKGILSITLKEQENSINIIVEDQGEGINRDVEGRVFEPFFTTKDVGKGIGLGLSVAYFIVTEHLGGDIQILSKPGKGTRFTLILPLNESKEDDRSPPYPV